MTDDTTTINYWLYWRSFLCSVTVLAFMALSLIILRRFEYLCNSNHNRKEDCQIKTEMECLYSDEAWKPCLKGINPTFVLAYRMTAFIALLTILISSIVIYGFSSLTAYVQWTSVLVTIYFGFGSSFSICGYYRCKNRVDGDQEVLDAEQGIAQGACNRFEGRKDTCGISRSLDDHEESHARQVAGTWGFIFQICYQACAGAVVLTDSVYWLIIVPLFPADYFHSGFLPVSMHSVNAFLLIGDSILNRMRFPFFRIAYFFLFTVTYISFQWIIEGLFKIRSPYHFIDLSSPTTPLWYVFLALIHVPCYGIFAVIIWIKHFCLSRLLPESYQGMR